MPTPDQDELPARFRAAHNQLGYRWHQAQSDDPRVENLRGEALKALGQCEIALARVLELEHHANLGTSRIDSTGTMGSEIELMTETFYCVCHRFLKLCEKVPALGLEGLHAKLRRCDVVLVRNQMIDHVENPSTGIPGPHFGWDLPDGPVVKPWSTGTPKLRHAGCYAHADEVLSALELHLSPQRPRRS